jgi:hypothetical protein
MGETKNAITASYIGKLYFEGQQGICQNNKERSQLIIFILPYMTVILECTVQHA